MSAAALQKEGKEIRMSGKEWLKKWKAWKKDRAVILLLAGILLLIAFPSDSKSTDSSGEGLLSGLSGLGGTEESEASADSGGGEEQVSAAALSGTSQEGTSFENISGSLSGVSEQASEEALLEARLAGILSRVEGVGDVQVMITLKSSGEKQVEKDAGQSSAAEDSTQEDASSSSGQTSDSESTVFEKEADGSETPYVTQTLAPEIQGVLVIAQGAGSPSVVSEITEAVTALFGTEAHKIKVMKME